MFHNKVKKRNQKKMLNLILEKYKNYLINHQLKVNKNKTFHKMTAKKNLTIKV